jgi:hypothetical protein
MFWGREGAKLINKIRASRQVILPLVAVALFGVAANTSAPKMAVADEGGVSYRLPGQFGSLAAVPAQPGWSYASIYYHTSVNAGGNVSAARQVSIGKFSPTVNVNLNANLNVHADLVFLNGNYVFATPVLGGQFALGMTGAFGRSNASIDGTLTAVTGGLTTTRQGSISDSRGGVGDLYPMASLRWNSGVNNFMTYLTGDIPVGTYDSSRLANFGIGHGAIDGGGGYTYFNPQTGREFSMVTGLTYNFKNTNTDYQNGIDWHLDWGLSQFLSKQFTLVSSVTTTISLPATVARARHSAISNRALQPSAHRSDTCSRLATCRAISTLKATTSTAPITGLAAGTLG